MKETEIKNLLAILSSNNYKAGLQILQNISCSEYKEILKHCYSNDFGTYFSIKNYMFYKAPDYDGILELIQTINDHDLP